MPGRRAAAGASPATPDSGGAAGATQARPIKADANPLSQSSVEQKKRVPFEE
jgi:hypothetical protein